MELGLQGRVALVTGGAVGIGASIAASLAREGCRVWIGDRDTGQAQRTADEFRIAGLQAQVATLDVTEPESAAEVVAYILAMDGSLDILVCNAGILKSGSFLDSSPQDWESIMAVNLAGVANCVREAARPMARQGSGRIVNIASISAMRGGGSLGNTLYGTSKAGVVALTMGLARELGPSGITVNAVAPSVADTPMTRSILSDEVRDRIIARIPLGRLATPADIADAVTFLASDRASFINGAVLPVDGGILTT
jgi:NAD(P)-dependent dehydrogenase (short-subunit alcohol dehydrogenase family)